MTKLFLLSATIFGLGLLSVTTVKANMIEESPYVPQPHKESNEDEDGVLTNPKLELEEEDENGSNLDPTNLSIKQLESKLNTEFSTTCRKIEDGSAYYKQKSTNNIIAVAKMIKSAFRGTPLIEEQLNFIWKKSGVFLYSPNSDQYREFLQNLYIRLKNENVGKRDIPFDVAVYLENGVLKFTNPFGADLKMHTEYRIWAGHRSHDAVFEEIMKRPALDSNEAELKQVRDTIVIQLIWYESRRVEKIKAIMEIERSKMERDGILSPINSSEGTIRKVYKKLSNTDDIMPERTLQNLLEIEVWLMKKFPELKNMLKNFVYWRSYPLEVSHDNQMQKLIDESNSLSASELIKRSMEIVYNGVLENKNDPFLFLNRSFSLSNFPVLEYSTSVNE